MKNVRFLMILVALVAVTLACGLPAPAATATPGSDSVSATTEAPVEEPTADVAVEPTAAGSNSYETEFPLPADVTNFTSLPDGMVNFQVKMSVKDALKFYQDALTKEGYTERPLLTSTTDTTLSTVFDGHESGKAIVIQAVDLGGGNLNISIRLEAVN